MGNVCVIIYFADMDKLYLICVLVFVNFFSVSAQTGLLRGSVHDRDGTPLAAAVVMLMRDSVRVAATTCRIDGIFEDNAENDFWTIKLITDHYINENNETYNHDVVQGNYFFVNTGICSL